MNDKTLLVVWKQKKRDHGLLSNLFHKLLIRLGSGYLCVAIWTDKTQGLAGLLQENVNVKPWKVRLYGPRGSWIGNPGSKVTALGGWLFGITQRLIHDDGGNCWMKLLGGPGQSQGGEGKMWRRWAASFLLPSSNEVVTEKCWRPFYKTKFWKYSFSKCWCCLIYWLSSLEILMRFFY